MCLSCFELVGSTCLKETLLVTEEEFFIGFTFFFDGVADHGGYELRIKFCGILSNSDKLSNFFYYKK